MQQENLYTEYRPMKETKTELTLVPYYAWNNRGEGEMSVWIRIQPIKNMFWRCEMWQYHVREGDFPDCDTHSK